MKKDQNLYKLTADSIIAQRQNLAKIAVDRQYASKPQDWLPYAEAGYQKSLRDAEYNFTYLSEAIAINDFSILLDYVTWLKIFFSSHNFPAHALADTLKHMRPALQDVLAPDQVALAIEFIDQALQRIPELDEIPPSFLTAQNPLHELAANYLSALLQGDRHSASRLILDAVEQDTSIKEIYLQVFQDSQREVGRLWHIGQITVAQEHFCTAATQVIISQLYPYIFATEKIGRNLVATCVGDELHELGMRMVADFFEMEGWDTYFLGANTPASSILSAIQERRADLLAVSSTLPVHVSKVADLIKSVRMLQPVTALKILVGGYSFNLSDDLWKAVEADGYAPDALQGIEVANRLLEQTP